MCSTACLMCQRSWLIFRLHSTQPTFGSCDYTWLIALSWFIFTILMCFWLLAALPAHTHITDSIWRWRPPSKSYWIWESLHSVFMKVKQSHLLLDGGSKTNLLIGFLSMTCECKLSTAVVTHCTNNSINWCFTGLKCNFLRGWCLYMRNRCLYCEHLLTSKQMFPSSRAFNRHN